MIEIIFQEGTFYSDGGRSLLGVSWDALFTGLVSFIVFGVGFYIKSYSENKKKREELNEVLSFAHSSVLSLENAVEQDRQELKRIINHLKEKPTSPFEFNPSSSFDLTNLESMDNMILFQAFKKRKGKKHKENVSDWNSIIASVRLLSKIKYSIESTYYDFISGISEFESNFENAHKQINYLKTVFDTRNNDSFSDKLDKIYTTFTLEMQQGQKADSTSIDPTEIHPTNFQTKKHLINPLRELCNDNLQDERSVELSKLIRQCNIAYSNIIHREKHLQRRFEHYSLKLNQAYSHAKGAFSDNL